MTRFKISRRTFVEGGLGLTVANFLPGTTPFASAATMEESTIAAAKKAGAAQVKVAASADENALFEALERALPARLA